MQKAILLCGLEIYKVRLRYSIFFCNIFHFNWYESIYNNNAILRIWSFIKNLSFLCVLKLLGKKIIFTFHNKKPHVKLGQNIFSSALQSWFMKHADGIIIHSWESLSFMKDIDRGKIFYVPHPNYISVYPETKIYDAYTKKDGEIIFTFIGQVLPYKCLDVLINTANQLQEFTNMRFLICGSAQENYKKELQSMIKSKNITSDFRFIEDGEISSLLEMSDAVLLPYSTESELNSGASYLAFSFGKTIITTRTGTAADIENLNLIYCYDYTEDKKEHSLRLKNAIMNFYHDFMNDKSETKRKGETLKKIMEQKHSLEETAKALEKVYSVQ